MRRHSLYEKVMTILLGLVIIAVISFLMRAVMSPQMSIKSEISINAQEADIWPFLTEESKRVNWQTGVRTVVNLMGGDLMVGTRSVVVKKIGAKQWEIEEEVIDYLEGQTIVIVHSSEQYVEDITINLEQRGGAVVLSYNSSKVYSGFMDNVLAPWSSYKEKQALELALGALKRNVEGV